MKNAPAIPEAILRRKGARTTAGVPAEVRRLLELGHIETLSLCEWLVVDQRLLAERVFTEEGWPELLPPLRDRFAALKTPTAPKRTEAVGAVLAAGFPARRPFERAYQTLLRHRSDVVRSWSGYMVGNRAGLTLPEKLTLVRPLAADSNMGVRETAWFAVREAIAAELSRALELLMPFALDPDARVRRFASEATRPRGVWCRHIQPLKDDPSPALPLLEPLKSDPSKYVRDSVANWLNDASKSRPDWVQSVCRRWEKESPTPETQALLKRALRTLRKKAG